MCENKKTTGDLNNIDDIESAIQHDNEMFVIKLFGIIAGGVGVGAGIGCTVAYYIIEFSGGW